MLYQKLLGGERPYHALLGGHNVFGDHRHSELELSYCTEGSYRVCIGGTSYLLQQGDFLVIGSMCVHSYDSGGMKNMALTIEVGPAFLNGFFDAFARLRIENPLLSPGSDARHHELHALLEETVALCREDAPTAELLIKGNLYKICAYILKNFPPEDAVSRNLHGILSIERALEMIRTRYAEPLRIEAVARENGYRESNFCKVFKSVTGETFHSALNHRRVEVACMLLRDSNDAVESIAQQVGFGDAKAFCRVFKSITGVTPNTYRKSTEMTIT